MTSRRIAVVAESAPPAPGGGIASSHHHLAQLLTKAGHDVHVFTYMHQGLCATSLDHVTRLAAPRVIERLLFSAGQTVFRLLDHGRTAYQTPDILSALPGALRLSRPIQNFGPDLVILPDQGAPGLAIDLPKQARVVLVAHHNPSRFLDNPLLGQHSALDAKLAIRLEQFAVNKASRVVCPSAYMAGAFKASYRFSGPIDIVPNLIDEQELAPIPPFDFASALGIDRDVPVIYIPSAGSRYKGARFVPELMRRLVAERTGRVAFYLSGSIPSDMKAELAQSLPGAQIFMPGHVTQQQNIGFVKGCAFALSPTLIENFSMAFLEALYCSLPIVTFDVGGNREMIEDGQNGHIVPYLDVTALFLRSLDLLASNRLSDLRSQTLAHTHERFSPSLWLPRWTAHL
jgi:glycosyltransferase involved in cell wall biosynthesis